MRAASDRGWVDQAACRDEPSHPFTDPSSPDEVRAALVTCSHCDVRRQCLTAALELPADADIGIWGGTTEHDRSLIRNGTLTVEAALQRSIRTEEVTPAQPLPPRRREDPSRLPEPEVTVARTRAGEYQSADGRIVVFRIHGEPPWMLMIDRRPIARTDTVTEARRVAWRALHGPAEQAVAEACRIAWKTAHGAAHESPAVACRR